MDWRGLVVGGRAPGLGRTTPRSVSRLEAASSVEAPLNADAESASEAVGLAGRRRPEETEAGEACLVLARAARLDRVAKLASLDPSVDRTERSCEATLDDGEGSQD